MPPAKRPRPPVKRAADDSRARDTAAALDAIRRVVRELRLAARRAEADAGLSAAQLFVLQQVAAVPGQSLSELAERTLTDRTSVRSVVERLAALGVVERRQSAADRRRVEIFPAAGARSRLARAPHPPTRRLLDGLAALDDQTLRQAAAGLSALVRAMGLTEAPATMLFEEGGARRGGSGRHG